MHRPTSDGGGFGTGFGVDCDGDGGRRDCTYARWEIVLGTWGCGF